MAISLEEITQECMHPGIYDSVRPTKIYSVEPGKGARLSPLFKMHPDYAMDKMAENPEKLRAIFYIDEKSLNLPNDSTRYLGMTMALDPQTQVYFTTDRDESLATYADIVVPRMDPPLDYDFSRALDEFNDGKRTFVNPPHVQRLLANKSYLQKLMPLGVLPETLISKDLGQLTDFAKSLGNEYVIVKPVVGFGGEGVERVSASNQQDLERALYNGSRNGRSQVICQEYVQNVAELGDKRVFLLDGEPVGSILRLPKKGDYLCNVKKGGSTIRSDLTDENYQAIERIKPLIKANDMHFVGIDLIGKYVMEINGLSPGLVIATDNSTQQLYSKDGVAGKFTNWAFQQKN